MYTLGRGLIGLFLNPHCPVESFYPPSVKNVKTEHNFYKPKDNSVFLKFLCHVTKISLYCVCFILLMVLKYLLANSCVSLIGFSGVKKICPKSFMYVVPGVYEISPSLSSTGLYYVRRNVKST